MEASRAFTTIYHDKCCSSVVHIFAENCGHCHVITFLVLLLWPIDRFNYTFFCFYNYFQFD